MHYFGATKRSCFQDECWWGCQIGSIRTVYQDLGIFLNTFDPTSGTTDYFSPLVIADLECLAKCRQQNALFETCFGDLLDNVTSTGTDPVTITAANTCNAACFAAHAKRLYTADCQQFLKQQPSIIQDTILNIILETDQSANIINYHCVYCIVYSYQEGSCVGANAPDCTSLARRKRRSVRQQPTRSEDLMIEDLMLPALMRFLFQKV